MVASADVQAWMAGGAGYFDVLAPHLREALPAWHHAGPAPARDGSVGVERAERERAEALAALGGINALVYFDAGRPDDPEGALPSPADMYRACEGELASLLAYCQVAAKGMVAAKVPGAVTVVADVAGRIGRPEALASAVFSGAALGFVKCLAKEMARYRIRVNAVCYGHLEGFPKRVLRPAETRLMQATGLGGIGSPAALARAIAYLSRPDTHMTGQTLTVDGGLVV